MKKNANKDLLFTTKVVADFFGVTPRSLQLWVKNGCPKIKHGIYDLKSVFEWWMDNVADIKVEGDANSMNAVKLDYWRAKGEAERVKVDILRGSLIDREEIYREWAKRVLVMFAGLEGLKNRLPPILRGKKQSEMSRLIGEELQALQAGLCKPGAKYPPVKIKKRGKTCKRVKKKNGQAKKKRGRPKKSSNA
jgi:hypothetical protein